MKLAKLKKIDKRQHRINFTFYLFFLSCFKKNFIIFIHQLRHIFLNIYFNNSWKNITSWNGASNNKTSTMSGSQYNITIIIHACFKNLIKQLLYGEKINNYYLIIDSLRSVIYLHGLWRKGARTLYFQSKNLMLNLNKIIII
jgi:hypothetical protein